MKKILGLVAIFIGTCIITMSIIYFIFINKNTLDVGAIEETTEVVELEQEDNSKPLNIEEMTMNEIKEEIKNNLYPKEKKHFLIMSNSYNKDSLMSSTYNYWTDGDKFKIASSLSTIPEYMASHYVRYRDIVFDGEYYKLLEDKLDYIKISKDMNKLKDDDFSSGLTPLDTISNSITQGEFLADGTYYLLINDMKIPGKWELDITKKLGEEQKTTAMEERDFKLVFMETEFEEIQMWVDTKEFIVYSAEWRNKKDKDRYTNMSILDVSVVEGYPDDFFDVREHSSDLKEIEY